MPHIEMDTVALVYHLKLNLHDTAGVAFTDQVCLALLNRAAAVILNEAPTEQVGAGLYEVNQEVTLSSGTGDLPLDVLRVDNARQASSPSRPADDVLPVGEYQHRVSRSMLRGTYNRPMVGVDLAAKKIYLDAGGYSGNVDIDYVRQPIKLAIDGTNDEAGFEATETVDPDWPASLTPPILDKAIKKGIEVQNLVSGNVPPEQMAALILRRLA